MQYPSTYAHVNKSVEILIKVIHPIPIIKYFLEDNLKAAAAAAAVPLAFTKSCCAQRNMEQNFLFSKLTLGAAKSHDQGTVTLVELPETGAASSVSDDGQLPQDESLLMNETK